MVWRTLRFQCYFCFNENILPWAKIFSRLGEMPLTWAKMVQSALQFQCYFLLSENTLAWAKNVFSLGRKASHLNENRPENRSKFILSSLERKILARKNMQKTNCISGFSSLFHYFKHYQSSSNNLCFLHNNIATYEISITPKFLNLSHLIQFTKFHLQYFIIQVQLPTFIKPNT